MFAIALIASVSVFSQDRVDKKSIIWETKSQPFTSSIGWVLDEKTGKWVSSPNLIKEEFWNIEYTQQFNSLQFRMLKYDNKNYYAFIIKKIGVYWDYPSIGRGFHTFPQQYVYVLEEEEFNKLKTLDSECTIKMKFANSSEYYYVVDKKESAESFITNTVRKELDNTGISYGYYNMKIIKTTSKGKTVFRFLLPTNSYTSENIDLSNKYFESTSISQLVTLLK